MKQKFHTGDVVSIGPLPETMRHFSRHNRAIVLHSYKDMYGGRNHDDVKYSLHIPGQGSSAWYPQSLLKLVKKPKYCACCKALMELLWDQFEDVR